MGQETTFFKRSDCQQTLRGRFRRVSRLIRALEMLTERNFISAPKKISTQKPTIIYEINPKLKLREGGRHGMA